MLPGYLVACDPCCVYSWEVLISYPPYPLVVPLSEAPLCIWTLVVQERTCDAFYVTVREPLKLQRLDDLGRPLFYDFPRPTVARRTR
jgi:hypothetical protein